MSLRAREGLPEHTHMMTPSQLHTHLHHEAYKDIEDRFANADSRRSKLLEATRSVSVERAKKVRAMLERVDHLRAGKPVDVSGFSRRPQEVLDTLNEAGQMPAAAYAREMRRADAAEATFARRTEEQRTLRPEDKKLKSHYFLDREQKIKTEKVTGTVRDTRSRPVSLFGGATRPTLTRVLPRSPVSVPATLPGPRAAAFRGDESYRAAARGRASGREAVQPHRHPLETEPFRRLRVPNGRRRRDAQAQLRDLAHGPQDGEP